LQDDRHVYVEEPFMTARSMPVFGVVLTTALTALSPLSAGCAANTEDSTDSSNGALSLPNVALPAPSTDPLGTTTAAFDALQNQLTTGALAPHYPGQPGSLRATACWENPAGKALSEIQKAFYCSLPLEFRLCNSVKLKEVHENLIGARYAAFKACQVETTMAWEGHTHFMFDAKVNQTYLYLFLNKYSGLTPAQEAAFIAKYKPAPSGKEFTSLLGTTFVGFVREVVDFKIQDTKRLFAMVAEFVTVEGL
jgi:hypothetical protein